MARDNADSLTLQIAKQISGICFNYPNKIEHFLGIRFIWTIFEKNYRDAKAYTVTYPR